MIELFAQADAIKPGFTLGTADYWVIGCAVAGTLVTVVATALAAYVAIQRNLQKLETQNDSQNIAMAAHCGDDDKNFEHTWQRINENDAKVTTLGERIARTEEKILNSISTHFRHAAAEDSEHKPGAQHA